ncbi:MAG: guanylate kinase [Ignavibacteriaceae bacterium]
MNSENLNSSDKVKKGKILVISAPSGAGKTTLTRQIISEFPDIIFSTSATTRNQRSNEIDGVDYFFISEEIFLNKIDLDEFAEWERFYDCYYGTYREQLENTINSGKHILLEIDVKGALKIKHNYPEAVLIFIDPPSIEALISRLKNRKTENEEEFRKRIERAKMELSLKGKFDYLVVNDNLDLALSELKIIINKITT